MTVYDVTIIGGGPVGLFGATMARLHGMSAKIIESLPELGGQLFALYPEKPIYDVAGFPEVPAKDLAAQLIAQAERFSPAVCVGESVEKLEATDHNTYLLHTNVATHETRAVLITVGIGAFTPRRLPAQGAESFEERGVYYFVPRFSQFSGQRVVVVGGGDTAVDWTLAIAPHAETVTLVHRRNEFRAQEESLRRIQETPNIIVKTPAEVAEIYGGEAVEGVVLHYVGTEETEKLAVDAVVGGLGFHPNLGPVKSWGLEFVGSQAINVSPENMQTNLPGVFCAGDVAHYPGKVKLIATGFGEIGIAVAQIRTYLDPKKHGLPHSTNIKTAKDPLSNPS